MNIPKQLAELRFCRVKKGTKKPFEDDWNNKPYTYDEISKYFPQENYGVLCGYCNLVVIDCDNSDFAFMVQNIFPETYTVKTGNGGFHFYFQLNDGEKLDKKIILKLDDDSQQHLGEVQTWGTQVVGVYCLHPNGNTYELFDDKPITKIPLNMILKNLQGYFKQVSTAQQERTYEQQEVSDIDSLSITSIFNTAGMRSNNKGEYFGCHPIHGSTGGMNFWLNSNKNIWHCFRCNSGGGVLAAIAVQEGLINCSDSKAGSIRGHLARECILIARHKYGFTGDFKSHSTKEGDTAQQKKEEKKKEDYKLIWDDELENYKVDEKEWIVDKLIPSKAVCIITGKRGTMKTFFTLLLSYSVASGSQFLDKFKTSQGKVIYLDKENGINIMKNRTKMLKKGFEKNGHKYPIGFICFSQIKLDKLGGIAAIEEVIEHHKPRLLVIDTYRRSVGFDENDAGKVSELFVDTLRPIVEKNNISVILIHHNRKSATNHGEVSDEMDELRGSSDLANYADLIIKLERHGNKIVIKQLKNRNAEELQPFSIKVNFCEDKTDSCVRMIYEGDFIKHTKGDKCVEDIILWINENEIQTFKTSDLKELCFIKGHKKNQLHNALKELQEKGIISCNLKGLYEVETD